MADPSRSSTRVSLLRPLRLARKELRETLRDRRTILTLVLMPLLVYPLLGLTFQKFLLTQAAVQERPGRTEYVVGFESAEEARRIDPLIPAARHMRFANENDREASEGDAEGPALIRGFWSRDGEISVEQLLEAGAVDIGMLLGPERAPGQYDVTILYNPDSVMSLSAKWEIEDRLRTLNELTFQKRLEIVGGDQVAPIAITTERVRAAGDPAVTVAAVLPFILLLMTATGAVYPAIDLTAGERERGTLEALVAAPVSRRAILAAKYAAVFTVAVLTAGMNLIAMTATVYSLGLDKLLFGGGLDANAISQVVALVLVLAAFFSAILLLVTSFARSFKEAQAYLIPVMLVSLAPGIVSMMPDLKLTLPLAVSPLIGVVLLARDLMTGGANGLLIVIVVGSTLCYAALALMLAAHAFGTDAVLYGSEGTWTDLFRRPDTARTAPPITVGTACLVLVVPAFLLLGPIAGRMEDVSVTTRLAINAGLTALLFFALPTLAAVLSHALLRSTFRLDQPAMVGLVGAILLGISLWPFAYELTLLFSGERLQSFREMFESIRAQLDAVSLPTKLLALAIVPAICEEWFFRGFLLSSLRTKLVAWAAVLVSGLLFGVFHVVVRDALFFERALPSAFLGIILGAVCVRTGSLWPGVLLHVLHNGLLLTLAHYERDLIAAGWTGGERTHLPWTWLLAAAVVAAVGGTFVWFARRRIVE